MLQEKLKFPKLILHQNDIQEGDIIAYHCTTRNTQVEAEVIGLLEPVVESVIICRRLDEEMADLVDFKKTDVFIVSSYRSLGLGNLSCECGAAYTSNPHFHLSYCPLR